jgi:hypothetical protein
MFGPNGWPNFDSASAEIHAGSVNGGGPVWGGWRWTGLNIPAGAQITAAYVELTNSDANWDVTTVLSLEDTRNPSVFSEGDSPYHRWQDRTDFEAVWRWKQSKRGSAYQTPSLVNGIQELVNRHGGLAGLVFLEDGSGNTEGSYHSWEAFEDSPRQSARLVIQYRMP